MAPEPLASVCPAMLARNSAIPALRTASVASLSADSSNAFTSSGWSPIEICDSAVTGFHRRKQGGFPALDSSARAGSFPARRRRSVP